MGARESLFAECREKLLTLREEALNNLEAQRGDLADHIGGDEGDMAQALQSQNATISHREKLMRQIREIDEALGRMDDGSYGICAETEEEIEPERLRAVPWTNLSLEGAQIREHARKRFG